MGPATVIRLTYLRIAALLIRCALGIPGCILEREVREGIAEAFWQETIAHEMFRLRQILYGEPSEKEV